MWTWPLGSAIWVTAAHRTSEGVADGTCTQVWAMMTNKCRIRMDRRKIYKIRDLSQVKGGSPGWGEGHRFLLHASSESDQMGVRTIGQGARSPQIASPSTSVFLVPTRSSPPSTLTVVSSKPNSYTHYLQIHCNRSTWPRSHLSRGLGLAWKMWTLHVSICKLKSTHNNKKIFLWDGIFLASKWQKNRLKKRFCFIN